MCVWGGAVKNQNHHRNQDTSPELIWTLLLQHVQPVQDDLQAVAMVVDGDDPPPLPLPCYVSNGEGARLLNQHAQL